MHDALQPMGSMAARIAELWWLYFWISVGVYSAVIVTLVIAVRRRAVPTMASERRAHTAIAGAVAVTIVTLAVLTIADFLAGRSLRAAQSPPLRIAVTAHQWWWEIEYLDQGIAGRVRSANELSIPVGEPVELVMRSRDVIHSFWVPSLHGKKDLIPGYTTRHVLVADAPGRYEGQCAEYCGYQHTNMRLVVHALPAARFEAWLERERLPARAPTTAAQRRGQEIFLRSTCAACHAVQGTQAQGTVGPDLTHLASRTTLAAGTLPNTKGHLGGWIADAQHVKPGSQMPSRVVAPQDLPPLLEYLTSLR